MRRSPVAADLVLVAVTAIWGTTFVTVKGALADADPFTFLALRFGVGGFAACCLAGNSLRTAQIWKVGAPLGFLLFAGYALQTLGLESIGASRSAFITGLCVLFVPFTALALARIIPGVSAAEGIRGRTVLAIVVALLGLRLLTNFQFDAMPAVGDVLTLGCAVAYAWHIAALSRFARGLDAVALVAVQLMTTALLSAIAATSTARPLALSVNLVGAVLLTGVLASAIAISLQAWAQARTSAARAAIIFSLEPVFALLWGAVVAKETLGVLSVIGGALMVAAVLFNEIAARSPGPP